MPRTSKSSGPSPIREKPTLADVARAAGVSSATVSYVLNKRMSEVSKKTADNVMVAVRELGYVKNLTASALSGKRSNMIAVITIGAYNPELDHHTGLNPFFGEFLFRLEAEARTKGYAMCLYGGREEEYVNFLLERYVDAAVLVGFSEWDLPRVLEREDLNLILYDSFGEDGQHAHVRTDEFRGGALAAEHLVTQGRRHLAFLGGSVVEHSGNIPAVRFKGAKQYCDGAGINLTAVVSETTYDAGVAAAREVIATGADAVVTTADILAAGLLEGLEAEGLKVPGDIAVMGYDNLPISRHVRPRLSTIDQGLDEKIKAVVDLVAEPKGNAVKVVEPKLVVRESA